MSTNHNYGTIEPHRTSSPSFPGSDDFVYINTIENKDVGPPPRPVEAPPTMPERSQLRYYVILFAVVLCIAILGCVSLSKIFVFYTNTLNGPAISYTTILGLYSIILIFVAAPSSLVLCFQPNNEARSFCSAKCTLFVAVFVAAMLMLTGATVAGLLQIFFTTQCKAIYVSMVQIGSISSVLNLLIAPLCIFVAIFSMLMCYRDHSRKSSNLCVGVFIFQMLIFNSEVVALILSSYSFSYAIYYDTFQPVVWVGAFSIDAVVVSVLLLCSCIFGPILCNLDRNKHIHFNKVGGIYLIISSICTVGVNIIAAILMFVPAPSLMASSWDPPYDCETWHPSALLALSLISGFMHFVVTCIGLFSVCFGCKYLRARRIEENNIG